MILVTIGTQEPFDRLIKSADEIASQFSEEKFIAQINNSGYQVNHMTTYQFITPEEFNRIFSEAKLIISHAGMGTIISALTKEKPLLILPRLSKLGEHRNDHQLATARKISQLGYAYVAFNEIEFKTYASKLIKCPDNISAKHIGEFASTELITSIKNFIKGKNQFFS